MLRVEFLLHIVAFKHVQLAFIMKSIYEMHSVVLLTMYTFTHQITF